MNASPKPRLQRNLGYPRAANLIALLLLISVFGTVGCSFLIRQATTSKRQLTYVGQVSFGVPQSRDGGFTVPMKFDGGEWLQNSGIVLQRIDTRVSGQTITMTAVTATATGDGSKKVPPELRLESVPPGRYTVEYADPDGTRHPLGEIEIPAIP